MKCQRKKFQLSKKTAYINCATMGPLMKKVVQAGRKGISRKCQPNKIIPGDFFNEADTLKKIYSKLINNPEPSRIALIPSVSYGISTVANNIPLKKGENIVIVEAQFPSNVYPWKNLCEKNQGELKIVAAPNTTERRGEKWNQGVINTINEKTKAVAIGHVHWNDGTLFDLKKIRVKCDEVGAALIIDGTQSIGALSFDIQEIKPDALVVAGYKWLLGPYSTGLAYYGKLFDSGEPIEYSWMPKVNSDKFSELVEYQDEYQEGAARYDMGEKSNFILNPMLIESIKQVIKWSPEAIQEYCRELTKDAIIEIKKMGLYIEDEDLRSSHIFGIKIPDGKLDSIQNEFKASRISVSYRGEFIRVSPHVYNDERDVRKLVKALKTALSR